MSTVTSIAMWSGPRNISTAMMRAWENRGDTAVWDEPLYAYYLKTTGSDHPGADEVIAAGEPDWQKVVARILGDVPGGDANFFQKHMTHHLLPDMDWDWLGSVSNCFLLRDPREVIASYVNTRANIEVSDVGVLQQAKIFDYVTEKLGQAPIVFDSRDVLENPAGILAQLCETLGVAFSERMLSWPPGQRETDGVWAKHWYTSVLDSTGFQPYQPKAHRLPKHLVPLAEECEPHYRRLYEERIRAE